VDGGDLIMARYAWLIDVTRCLGCNVCTVTCKDQTVGNDWAPYSSAQPDSGQFWISVAEHEWGKGAGVKVQYVSEPCMLCDNPPCVTAATGGAAYKRPDGIVIIDPVKSKGQKQIVDACPYGKVYWNDQLQIPQKCTLCAHRLDQGLQPACVDACPTNAIKIGDETALASAISAMKATVLGPELGTVPKAYYAGLASATTTT
jgi:tetrathionate reductase subunit B